MSLKTEDSVKLLNKSLLYYKFQVTYKLIQHIIQHVVQVKLCI